MFPLKSLITLPHVASWTRRKCLCRIILLTTILMIFRGFAITPDLDFSTEKLSSSIQHDHVVQEPEFCKYVDAEETRIKSKKLDMQYGQVEAYYMGKHTYGISLSLNTSLPPTVAKKSFGGPGSPSWIFQSQIKPQMKNGFAKAKSSPR